MTALPTASGVRDTLRWLISDDEPLTAKRLRDRFDLLSIPALSGEADPWKRAEMFMPVLRLAASELPPELQALAEHLLLHADPARVMARRNEAMDDMSDLWTREDRDPPRTKRQLDPYEAELIAKVATILVGDPLTLRAQNDLAYPPPVAAALSTPVGYHTVTQEIHLDVDVREVPRYTYVHHVRIVAFRRHVFLYVAKTDWTGSGSPPVEVDVFDADSRGHSKLGSRPDSLAPGETIWSHWIHLGRELSVGTPEWVHYNWTALDLLRSSRPHLRIRPISAMFEHIKLSASLPPGIAPVVARHQHFLEGEWKDVAEPTLASREGATHQANWRHLIPGNRYTLEWPRLY